MADFEIVQQLMRKGYKTIAGIDEAGRGALFGPVVAAAVALPAHIIEEAEDSWPEELEDSKRLTPQKRSRLAREIVVHATSVGIGYATNREIDERNIYWASLDAMKRAVDNLHIRPDYLLIDGFCFEEAPCPQMGIVQGDRKCSLISAASILAKVLRDEVMNRLDRKYHGYGLSQHKGYGTRGHYEALARLGATSLHRRSFRLTRGTC